MLSLHEELEETYFYPQLKKADAARDLVLEAYQEHHVMDVLLDEISALKPSSEEWEPKIKVLKENTEHHIEEEEGELFPKVRKIWDADKRDQVGRQMQQAKTERQKGQRAA
jgi:hemerythrin superfamily protein